MVKGFIALAAMLVIVLTFIAIIVAPFIGFLPVLGPGMEFLAAFAISIILISSFILGFCYYRIVGGIVAIMAMFILLWMAGMI